jgi:hypothetical protein
MKSVEELIRLLYVGQYEVKELPKLPHFSNNSAEPRRG